MSRSTALLALLVLPLAVACDKVALLAPTDSTLTLVVNTTTLPLNGTAEVLATVVEPAGTPVHNGTVVTFTATVGVMDPREARTEGGVARSIFRPNGQSGTAQISAFSGGARSAEPVEIRVGTAAAETISLRLDPANVSPNGSVVTAIATVLDPSGNPLPGAQVTFSVDNGTISPGATNTDAGGEARATLITNRQTSVRARVGAKEATASTTVINLPTVQLTASSNTPGVGVPVTFTITPGATTGGNPIQNVTFSPGDGSPVQSLGPISGTTTRVHQYNSAGQFEAVAEIRDTAGNVGRATVTVVTQRNQPTLTLTCPATATAGEPASFSVTATAAAGGPPITSGSGRIFWPDGTSASFGPGTTPFSKVFTTPGNARVTATVSDQAGTDASAQCDVTVRPRAALEVTLEANSAESTQTWTFSCLPTTGFPKTCTATPAPFANPQPTTIRVQFTATVSGLGTGDQVLQYQWNFDDGPSQTTNSRFNDHAFARGRTYNVTVTVTTAAGATGSARLTLVVQ